MLEVIIVGAGPAGLSAALVLGRCRRRTLICDAGKPRNEVAQRVNGFLTRDGMNPADLRRIGREQLCSYDTVEFRAAEVVDAYRTDSGFEVILEGGGRFSARKLLFATGVVDDVPDLKGMEGLYGRSVFHCPYCDGWEIRDQPVAIYGIGQEGRGELALELKGWSDDIILCTDGPAALCAQDREKLSRNRVSIREEPVARLEGADGMLARIVFTNGDWIARRALFFSSGQRQCSHLPEKLGCKLADGGDIWTGKFGATDVPGLYVAGDASRNVQFSIIAAAQGAEAAFAINTALLKEDLQ